MKSKLKIIIPAIIAVIAIIAAVICIRVPQAEEIDIQSLMSTAQKYLLEMEYEQAIAEFNKIIELEPKNVDAYLGLAQAYIDSGDIDKAVEVLEKGYDETGDERIKAMLEELLEGNAEVTETVTETALETTAPPTETEPESPTVTEAEVMPNLVGMSTGEAVSACSSMGIAYSIEISENPYVESGYVIAQSVKADSMINNDTSVVIVVSGKANVETTVITTVSVTSSVNNIENKPSVDSDEMGILQKAYDTVLKYFDDDFFYTGEPLTEKYYYSPSSPNGYFDLPVYNPIVKVKYNEDGLLEKMVTLYLDQDISNNIEMTRSDYGILVSTRDPNYNFISIGSGITYIYEYNHFASGNPLLEKNEKKGIGTLIGTDFGGSYGINQIGRNYYGISWYEFKEKNNNVYVYEADIYNISLYVYLSGNEIEKIILFENDYENRRTEYEKFETTNGDVEWCAKEYWNDEKMYEARQFREIQPDELFSKIIREFSEEDFDY